MFVDKELLYCVCQCVLIKECSFMYIIMVSIFVKGKSVNNSYLINYATCHGLIQYMK